MALAKTVLGTLLAAVTVAATAAGPAAPGSRSPLDSADFLERMSGEWTVVARTKPGPGQEPVLTESREVARLLGGKWLVAESEVSAPDGRVVTSILTLGYDPSDERFIGTWISSSQAHLWRYTGTLDDSGTTLTLETEGPILGDPTRTTQYRDVIEIEDADHRVTRSLILGPDGEWFEFARAEYRRSE